MFRAGTACCVAIASVLAAAHAGSGARAQSQKPAEKADESPSGGKDAAAKTRTGVRIELKVPQIPGVTAPSKPKTDSKSWPKTLPEAEAEKAAKSKPPAVWTPQEIADGRARCQAILKRIHAVAIPEEPMREGVCGTPAPIQLISVGRNPEVALSPPAIVNCDFAETLQTWIENDVQPLARKHLGMNVIKIEVMSSYSCRNAYGRAGNKLSEHGLANALDVRGFVTASGKTAYVLEDWGTPQREILARIAAEKAKAAKALAAAQAAEKAGQAAQATSRTAPAAPPPAATASSAGAPAAGIARTTISDGLPKVIVTLPGASRSAEAQEDAAAEGGFSIGPSHLGGPKPSGKKEPGATDTAAANGGKTAAAEPAAAPSAKAKTSDGERKEAFLHATHASACRTFGTTLGPEANAAHRNHLHIDLAQRKNATKICD